MPPEATGITAGSEAQSCSKYSPCEGSASIVLQRKRVVVTANRVGVALQLADYRARVNVVHSRQAHPFRDHAEVYAVRLLARISSVTRAVQVQNHAVAARPLRHRLNCGIADGEVNHHDDLPSSLAKSARSYISSMVPAVTFK